MGERHVVRDRTTGGWKIVGAHTGATEQHTDNQEDAIQAACDQLERADGGEVLIHGLDGTVRNRRTIIPAQRHET